MGTRRAVAVALLAVLGALVAVPAATVGSASPAAGPPAALDGAADATNVSLGTHVAAFVTAGVESAGENVERGMWDAAYENSDDRSARADLVAERTAALEARLADVEAEKRELVERRRNGEIEPVVFRARMSALAARLSALRASINHTAPRAAAVGADPARIQALRERARNASGPQLRRARSLGGGPPGGVPPGADGTPPGGGEGPSGEGPPGAGPGDGQPPGAAGPPTETPDGDDDCAGDGSGNGSDGPGHEGC